MRRIWHERLDSTNLEAQRLWRQERDAGRSLHEPLLLVAAEQAAGMGRSGRAWSSPVGGLWMSLAWPVRLGLEAYRALPLVVGLGVARALQDLYGLPCRIKWPNDILVHGRKLVGILCQSQVQGEEAAIVVGIGINGNHPAALLGDSLRHEPTTLLDLLGTPVDLHVLEQAVVARVVALLHEYEDGRFEERILPALRERLAWLDEGVACSDAEGCVLAQGVLRGVADDGCVLVERAGGETVALTIGELRLSAATLD